MLSPSASNMATIFSYIEVGRSCHPNGLIQKLCCVELVSELIFKKHIETKEIKLLTKSYD